jgi:hypothetical protein
MATMPQSSFMANFLPRFFLRDYVEAKVQNMIYAEILMIALLPFRYFLHILS